MILFYEKVITREMTAAICHYLAANNKYMYDYDELKTSTYILNLDFTNKNGQALSQLLSFRGFEFVEYLGIIIFNFIMNSNIKSNICYTLMVFVDLPLYFQPLHRDLTFLPKKRELLEKQKSGTVQCIPFTLKKLFM